MNDSQKLLDVLMDELPDYYPWEGELGEFRDRLIASNVVVQPHGRWVVQWCDSSLIGHEYEECSICGCAMLDTNQFWNSNYCPNCGAKMDLKV